MTAVRVLLLALLLAATPRPALAQDEPAGRTDARSRAAAAAQVLDERWATPTGWSESENWQRFPIVDALLAYRAATGDRRYDRRIDAAVRNRAGLVLNDDALWAVIASVDANAVKHDPALLSYAVETYGRIVGGYWDQTCGGGLWWDPARTYKNAITNELFFAASTRLYLATGEPVYLAWAQRSWSWLRGSGMIRDDGLVSDGLAIDGTTGQCRNNGAPAWTYNQGVLLGGLVDLAQVTGEPGYLHSATRTALAATRALVTPDGVLTEPFDALGRDGPMFKGVFARNLGVLVAALLGGAERAELQAFLARDADAVAAASGDGSEPIDGLWQGEPAGAAPQTGAAAQASGLDLFVASGRINEPQPAPEP